MRMDFLMTHDVKRVEISGAACPSTDLIPSAYTRLRVQVFYEGGGEMGINLFGKDINVDVELTEGGLQPAGD